MGGTVRGRKYLSALATIVFGAGIAVGAQAFPAAFAASPDVKCGSVSGAASVTPGLHTEPAAQTLQFDSFAASKCGAANPGLTLAITGSLESDTASCPLASGDRFSGALEIDWSNHFVSRIGNARLSATAKPGDPFGARLHGVITGGADAGDALDVGLHLTPTSGDCDSGVTSVAFANVTALTVGGPDATCSTVSGAATVTPGLHTAPGPQTLQFDSFAVSKCGAANRGLTLVITGSLDSDSASCPLASGESFGGALEIDWSNHFVSRIANARLSASGSPGGAYEARLHGVLAGADDGATLDVVLALTPTAGDCDSGVTNLAIAGVTALTIGGPDAKCAAVTGSATLTPGLSASPVPQSLHIDSFTGSRCGAATPGLTLAVSGTLQDSAPSCPLAPGSSFDGPLEIDWSNHFVSRVGKARLSATGNPGDPFEMRLRGVITGAADAGDSLAVLLDVTPNGGDCSTGITSLTIANVHALTIG